MSRTRLIAVGSQNPVKTKAALCGFELMFPNFDFKVQGYAVESGVSDQPLSCDETLVGATTRAKALEHLAPDASYFVGIEGGIETIDKTMFANAWIVIIDTNKNIGRGRSGSFALPPQVQFLVESGIELGHANDKVFGEKNSKQAGGAVGSLTGGIVSRQELYEHAMALALVGFRHPELYM